MTPVWSAAAKPQHSCSDDVWRKGPLPQCLVAWEHIVQQDAALCCPAGNWVNRGVFGVLRQSRSFRAATMFGGEGQLPQCLVAWEQAVQQDAA